MEFVCSSCRRTFESTLEDVELAGGHLCIAADAGLTQREAVRRLLRRDVPEGEFA